MIMMIDVLVHFVDAPSARRSLKKNSFIRSSAVADRTFCPVSRFTGGNRGKGDARADVVPTTPLVEGEAVDPICTTCMQGGGILLRRPVRRRSVWECLLGGGAKHLLRWRSRKWCNAAFSDRRAAIVCYPM